jgi:tetratricopeptide (TPR) repeat protein
VIHEKVAYSIREVAEREGYEIGTCDLLLSHSGYEGDQEHKHLRNLPLLEHEVALDPRNLFNVHHLGRVLEGLGRVDEAQQALERGVVGAREMARPDPLGTLVFAELVRLRRDRGQESAELLAEGRRLYPKNYVLLFLETSLDTDEGRYHEALSIYDQLLVVDKSVLPDAGPS